MQYGFTYERGPVLQALRFHFLSRPEVRWLIILVNVYTIIAAVLFYLKYIRPEPFVLGTVLWLVIMVVYWYGLPFFIYSRSQTFRESFVLHMNEQGMLLENEKGEAVWRWQQVSHFIESPLFYHIYFNSRSFILIPKPGQKVLLEEMTAVLNTYVARRKAVR